MLNIRRSLNVILLLFFWTFRQNNRHHYWSPWPTNELIIIIISTNSPKKEKQQFELCSKRPLGELAIARFFGETTDRLLEHVDLLTSNKYPWCHEISMLLLLLVRMLLLLLSLWLRCFSFCRRSVNGSLSRMDDESSRPITRPPKTKRSCSCFSLFFFCLAHIHWSIFYIAYK